MKNMIKIFLIPILLFSLTTGVVHSMLVAQKKPSLGVFDVGGFKVDTADVLEAVDEMKQAGEEEFLAREKLRKRLEDELTELSRQKDSNEIGQAEYDQRAARINARIKKLDKADEAAQEIGTAIAKNVQGIVVGGFNTAMEMQKEAGRRQTERELEAVRQAGGIKSAIEKWKILTNPQTLVRGGQVLTAVAGGTIAISYGCRFAFDQLSALLGKPSLVDQTSRKTFYESIKQLARKMISGQSEETIALGDVILPAALDESIKSLAEEARNAHISQLPLKNILLYGLPGTGKSMAAKALAYYSGMDYAIFSGANLAQFSPGKDVQELRTLLQWAKYSPRGTIIFIDEAEAILKKRSQLTDQGLKLLNTFLALTGEESSKIMFIFATNHPEKFDSAVLSRIGQKLEFPLPGIEERIKLLDMYISKKIRNDVRTIVRPDGQKIQTKVELASEINAEFLKLVAERIDGFSGREITQFVTDLRSAAYGSSDQRLTVEMFEKVLKNKIKQHQQASTWLVDKA